MAPPYYSALGSSASLLDRSGFFSHVFIKTNLTILKKAINRAIMN